MPSLDLEYSQCGEEEREVAVELRVFVYVCVRVGWCVKVYIFDYILL